MDHFCGSSFWDDNLTWNTSRPDFTSCFKETALIWVPCGFLWLFAPLEVYLSYRKASVSSPWTILVTVKLLLTSILGVLALTDMVNAMVIYSSGAHVNPSTYYSAFIKASSHILVLIIVCLSRLKGIHTSGVLFVFWLLLSCTEIITFRSALLYLYDESESFSSKLDRISFTTMVCSLPLVLAQLLLCCFSDAQPQTGQDKKKLCPEESASFLSQITFWWFNSMAYKGYKQPLVMDDMWNLSHQNTTESVMEKFDKFWLPVAAHVRRTRTTSVDVDGHAENVPNTPIIKDPTTIGIMWPVIKTFGWQIATSGLLKLVGSLLTFVSPIILNLLILFVSSNEPRWKGFFYAGLLLFSSMVESLINNQYEYTINCISMRVLSAVSTAVFKKSLVLSNSARRNYTLGEIVNLMSIDVQRVMDFVQSVHLLWSSPLQLALALYMLWQQIGVSTLGGLGALFLLVPFNVYFTYKIKGFQISVMKCKDRRTKLMSEILNGIKVLKLYGWEESFQDRVQEMRRQEIKALTRHAFYSTFITFLFTTAPFLIALSSFAMYVLIDPSNVLDANKAFVSLTLFNILRNPFAMLPMLVTFTIMFLVSSRRLNVFLSSREIDPDAIKNDTNSIHAIQIENGTFAWAQDEVPLLKNIHCSTKPGSLVAIVGTVGSGKSSILSALLGEMEKISGNVNVQGNISYVPQQAWIQNATLKQNVLFVSPFKEDFYKKVLKACCLNPDLEMLPGGDMTEIGEKGINLSGGQKQRISLARAVYNDADIYLLDDPLSAVDAHVSKDLFDDVIGPNGMLKTKTRVLVTHRINVLPECDSVIVLKDGMISEQGTYEELLQQRGAFADFLVQHLCQLSSGDSVVSTEDLQFIDAIADRVGSPELRRQLSRLSGSERVSIHSGSEMEEGLSRNLISQVSRISNASHGQRPAISTQKSLISNLTSQYSQNSNASSLSFLRQRPILSTQKSKVSTASKSISSVILKNKSKLTEEEQAAVGSVKWSVYLLYTKACGLLSAVGVILLVIASHAFNFGSSIWLGKWSNDAMVPEKNNDTALRDLRLGVYGVLGAAESFFLLLAVLLLSLCTLKGAKLIHDQSLDHLLRAPMSFFEITPLGRILNRFSKDIDSIDHVIRFNIRLLIISCIRIITTAIIISLQSVFILIVLVPVGIIYFYVQNFYIGSSRQLRRLESIARSPIFTHFSETVAGNNSIRAYGAAKQFLQESYKKMDVYNTAFFPTIGATRWLAVRLEFFAYIIAFLAALFAVLCKDSLSPGIVGLSVSFALSVTGTLNQLVRGSTEVETNIVSVERCLEYTATPTEAPRKVTSFSPPDNWPSEGVIIFSGFSTRYREGLDLVLKKISFKTKPGEKVGIVGRTGAGKSSLTLSLFRLIESVEGSIVIDGVDISKLGLYDLRSRLTIIPQDPVLFAGSLRLNLDPFSTHTDDAIWTALEHSHLKGYVTSLEKGLEHEITEGGENLSVGQCQLLCLGRALLRKTKVLIMDEATAAVDMETDELIQWTIRSEFKDCTVLTIAHRLNTVMDYDRIIVLDQGAIAEFDSPADLLKNESSIFYSMAKDAELI